MVVGERDRRQERRPVFPAAHRGEAAHRFGERAEAGAVAIRTFLPEGRHAQHDQTRMFAQQVLGIQVPLLERARPEVLDHDVEGSEPAAEEHLRGRFVEVHRDAALVAREGLPVDCLVVLLGPEVARGIAFARLFEFDDLGAVVAENRRTQRRCDHRREIEDSNAGERTGCEPIGHVDNLRPARSAKEKGAPVDAP